MGGHPWKVDAPWTASIEEVLATTRARVFEEGSYQSVPGRSFETLAALDAFFMRSPEDFVGDEEGDEEVDWSEGAEGTRSILDIRGVSAEVEIGCTAPVPDASLRAIFGTLQPTASAITEAQESAIYELLPERGQSYFVVCHDAHGPSRVTFYGYSWD